MTSPAKDNGHWTLNVTTHSRNQLIDISTVLANSFPVTLFQDAENIPYILVPGTCTGGKSMIIEAMMKALLDEYDVNDMKLPDAPRAMFIEKKPGDAQALYCQATGNTNGAPVLYGFDRVTNIHGHDAQNDLIATFHNAAKKHSVRPVGAIFSSNIGSGKTNPWLLVELTGHGDEWERSLQISVLNPALTSMRQFRYYWDHLQSFARTGILKKSALMPHNPVPQDLFTRNTDYPALPAASANAADYETELLKFTFWHHDDLGLSKGMVAHIAANMSDYGSENSVNLFIDWLKARDEQDLAAEIDACKSKLSRLFFKYVTPDVYKLDVSKFMRHTLLLREYELENSQNLQNKYHSYLARQLDSPDQEKVRNFLIMASTFIGKESENLKALTSPDKQRLAYK